MTSKLTRAQLEEWVAQFDEDGGCDATDRHLEALIRQSLAALDSEPVAWTWHYREKWHVTNDKRRAEFVAKDGDVAVLPLYRHAQPAPKVMQSESAIADCDPEVYEKGVSVCLVAIPKETAEIICQNITAATGCKVDWHYFGGRVHIKALRESSQPAPVVPDDVSIFEAAIEECKTCDSIDEHAWNHGVLVVMAKYESCRAAMLAAAPQPQNAPQNIPEIIPDCWFRTCRPVTLNDMRFVVCPDCGNKRCPRANDHRNACTGSNEPGQEGSAYPASPQEDINALIPLVSRNEQEVK